MADRRATRERDQQIADTVGGAAASRAGSQDRSKILMAKVRCAGCGAAIEQGMKFCSHCGMQIPDDTFRAEIRIDDSAEIQRVQYETEESRLRQKQAQQEFRVRKVRWIIAVVLAMIAIISFALGATVFNHTDKTGLLVLLFYGCICLSIYIVYVNLFKK